MSADLSRVRFDPLRDHSGIGSLQGRVWLDADFNEQVAITDRRLRAQVVDLAPAPSIVSRLTPDAFKIAEAGGVISISAGRMYVDGLLAENHGLPKTDLEPILAEPNGTTAIAYTQQPYRRAVTDAPTTGGQHLFYLVAWQGSWTISTPRIWSSPRSASRPRPGPRPPGRSACCPTWARV